MTTTVQPTRTAPEQPLALALASIDTDTGTYRRDGGSNRGREVLLRTRSGHRVRVTIRIDASYAFQSTVRADVWTPNGWTEVAHIDTHSHEFREACNDAALHGKGTDRAAHNLTRDLVTTLWAQTRATLPDDQA